MPWYTVIGEDFQKARGTTEYFSLDVYLRDGERGDILDPARDKNEPASRKQQAVSETATGRPADETIPQAARPA